MDTIDKQIIEIALMNYRKTRIITLSGYSNHEYHLHGAEVLSEINRIDKLIKNVWKGFENEN